MTATYARIVIDTVLAEKEVTVTPDNEYVDVLGAQSAWDCSPGSVSSRR